MRFSSDEPLLDQESASALASHVRGAEAAFCAPEASARETASFFDPNPVICPELRDASYGRWEGRFLAEIAEVEPEAVQLWMSDPSFSAHGGEAYLDVFRRATTWLDSMTSQQGHLLAVTHSLLVRTITLAVLDAPPTSLWKLDIPPLSATTLSNEGTRWAIKSVGATLKNFSL